MKYFGLSNCYRTLREKISRAGRSRFSKIIADCGSDAQERLNEHLPSEALSALPRHVQLILMWCAYMPLEDVLLMDLASFSRLAHLEDGTVAIYSLPGGLQVVPRELLYLTVAYITSKERMSYSPSKNEPFALTNRLYAEQRYQLTTAWNVREYVKTALEVCSELGK